MEDEGLIFGKFNEDMTQKHYQTLERGSRLLEREADTVNRIAGFLSLGWAK